MRLRGAYRPGKALGVRVGRFRLISAWLHVHPQAGVAITANSARSRKSRSLRTNSQVLQTMIRLSPFLFAILASVACQTSSHDAVAQETSPSEMTAYGDAITPDGAIGVDEFMKAMSTTDSLATKLDCAIITSCTVKGCWMDVELPDGGSMKVRFRDYGFFVPKQGLEGKRAIMQGSATRETFDVATLRHYAEDAGKSKEEIEAITEPKYVLTFLADGVLIGD